MKIVMFYHSLFRIGTTATRISSAAWRPNSSSAAMSEIYEPENGWSISNLIATHGYEPVREFRARFPLLRSKCYNLGTLDLNRALDGADLVLVHEWNDPGLVRRIGEHRSKTGGAYRLLFHDTHHRAVTAPEQMAVSTTRALRRRSRLRQSVAPSLSETPLGVASVDVARSGGHACVSHVAQLSIRGRSRLDR